MIYVEANSNAGNADYLSAVRFAIQDTTGELFSDAEITAQYNSTTSSDPQKVRNLTTAYILCRILHRRYGQQATFSSQGTSIQLLERARYFEVLMEEIQSDLMLARSEALLDGGAILYAGRSQGFPDDQHIGGSLGGIIIG